MTWDGPANSLQALAYTASIIKDLIDLVYAYEKKYNEKQTQSQIILQVLRFLHFVIRFN